MNGWIIQNNRFTLCKETWVKWEYKNTKTSFSFTFIRSDDTSNYLVLDTIRIEDFTLIITFLRNPNFLNDKINDKINDLDKAILGEIRKNKYITIPELSKKIGKSEPTIYRYIEGLMKKDMLKRMESRKTGYWKIIQ